MTRLARGIRPSLSCPECGHSQSVAAHADDDVTGTLILCHGCAAISVRDGSRYRALRTQEWMDLVLEPRFFDLLEERMNLLDRLTAPPSGLPIADPGVKIS
jgi:transcription elongation factor Elf1